MRSLGGCLAMPQPSFVRRVTKLGAPDAASPAMSAAERRLSADLVPVIAV